MLNRVRQIFSGENYFDFLFKFRDLVTDVDNALTVAFFIYKKAD